MLRLEGRLLCADEAEAEAVRAHLPEHVRLTRAEAGCLSFEVTPAGPLVWTVEETFTGPEAFEAHQSRVQGTPWADATAGIVRDYRVTQDPPAVTPE
ncbi:antibiotic biosynthesis monooxygenase [Roseicyclus sp. F158]|uniref:Antibiotic biosynthesis monooxygenase n=1 Tax=Tropicimonas omnivorans TaxID=3075590 RepID=A0ABU3DIE8_9RHOB|nr:antibiotic biosynthesis monooxygenase [Roseicyclus sp. F158]MDT0683478.1 antibiotic biosynthesis monooxygenase [Roseicyclus sp. F158]